MKALVTGSSGVIGRELIPMLVNRGYEVTGIDRKEPIYKIDAKYTDFRVDLNDVFFDTIDPPDVIFHLAASFERTIEDPGYATINYNDNIKAFQRLADYIATLKNCPRVVFASSYLVYADPENVKEDGLLMPRNLVGHAKLYAESVLKHMTEIDKTCNAISARIFRVYGRGSRDVISRWIRDILVNKNIFVFGANQKFDYIHAWDVANSLIRLSETEFNGVVNLGTGNGRFIKDIISVLLNKREVALTFTEDGPNEKSYADITLLKTLTNWQPQFDILEGIADVIEYETNRVK